MNLVKFVFGTLGSCTTVSGRARYREVTLTKEAEGTIEVAVRVENPDIKSECYGMELGNAWNRMGK